MALKDPAATLGTLGNYDLIDKLGEGSMGTVYKASHWTTREVVAIKVMPANIARKPMLLKRFEQEFRIASRVEHPNVVRVLEYNGRLPEPYLVMEFVDGVSLGDRLEREHHLPEAEAIGLIVQVAEGLDHAHQLGLLHRDVKPDNILVTANGVAKLTDLGLAKELDAAAELTRTGTGLGTPNFMAPEQFRDAKNADVRCDLYSLAATLYQMLCGELPFGQGDPVRILMNKMSNGLTPPRKLVPELSTRVERALLRAMDPEPERRHADCIEFVDDLLDRPPSRPRNVLAHRPAHEAAGGPAEEEDLTRTMPMRRFVAEARCGGRSTSSIPRADIRARLARPSTPTAPIEASAHVPTPPPDAAVPTVPNFVVPLSSQRHLPPEPAQPPAPAPAAPSAPPSAWRSVEHWKTALIVLLTGVATIAVSHILFFSK
jgi:serine/threonine protein kinase